MRRFPGFSAPSARLWISALAQRHGIELAQAWEGVTLEAATSLVAERLQVAACTPLLRLERTIWAASGEPVEWRVALLSLKEDLTYMAEIPKRTWARTGPSARAASSDPSDNAQRHAERLAEGLTEGLAEDLTQGREGEETGRSGPSFTSCGRHRC